MVEYSKVNGKLTDKQLKKLKTAVKNNTRTTLTLIRLGFFRVVLLGGAGGGGSQFDLPHPPSYFKKNLSNISITLYNC